MTPTPLASGRLRRVALFDATADGGRTDAARLDVRRVVGPEEMLAVRRLRRRVDVDELGYRMPVLAGGALAAEPLDTDGVVFAAFVRGEVVGAARVNVGRDRRDGGFGFFAGWYGLRRFDTAPAGAFPHGVALVSRLMLLPAWRSAAAVARLTLALYEHLRDREPQVRYGVTDCGPSQLRAHEQLGWRPIGPTLWHPMAGALLPLAFALYHREHLMRTGSPLAPACPRHDGASARWFDATFAPAVLAAA